MGANGVGVLEKGLEVPQVGLKQLQIRMSIGLVDVLVLKQVTSVNDIAILILASVALVASLAYIIDSFAICALEQL